MFLLLDPIQWSSGCMIRALLAHSIELLSRMIDMSNNKGLLNVFFNWFCFIWCKHAYIFVLWLNKVKPRFLCNLSSEWCRKSYIWCLPLEYYIINSSWIRQQRKLSCHISTWTGIAHPVEQWHSVTGAGTNLLMFPCSILVSDREFIHWDLSIGKTCFLNG